MTKDKNESILNCIEVLDDELIEVLGGTNFTDDQDVNCGAGCGLGCGAGCGSGCTGCNSENPGNQQI